MLAVVSVEHRHLDAARRAPGRPVIDDRNLAGAGVEGGRRRLSPPRRTELPPRKGRAGQCGNESEAAQTVQRQILLIGTWNTNSQNANARSRKEHQGEWFKRPRALSTGGSLRANMRPMWGRHLLCGAVLVCATSAAAADQQPICADRPGKATSACTVPAGHWQIETGLADWTLQKARRRARHLARDRRDHDQIWAERRFGHRGRCRRPGSARPAGWRVCTRARAALAMSS